MIFLQFFFNLTRSLLASMNIWIKINMLGTSMRWALYKSWHCKKTRGHLLKNKFAGIQRFVLMKKWKKIWEVFKNCNSLATHSSYFVFWPQNKKAAKTQKVQKAAKAAKKTKKTKTLFCNKQKLMGQGSEHSHFKLILEKFELTDATK